VSTQGQAEHGMSLADQADRIREYAARKGYELVRVSREAASGGIREGEELSYEHRPVLLELIDAAMRREFNVLLVAKLDRLSRDYPTLAVLERRLQRYGVEVVSTAEENGDGPLAEFIRGQLALVAQLERAMILERVRAGKAKKKALGRHVHGRIPYAYRSDRGVLEPIDRLASIVVRIFRDAREGDAPGRIARSLNSDGIPSPQGKQWTSKAVERVLTNPAYAGERYGVKRAHPAIVSRRVFNAANDALRQRAQAWAAAREQP
jgi:DNA invertase Pin-like site-specific DNA recombinase